MNVARILCSTGALVAIPNHRDYRLLEPLSRVLDCDGYEFMIYDSWYGKAAEIAAFTRDLGMYIPATHCEKYTGEYLGSGRSDLTAEAFRFFEIECDFSQKLGADSIVLHLWNGRTSDSAFENNLAAYGRLAAIAADYGEQLLIENVVCVKADPLSRWCELRERYPNVRFVFDTKMAAFHGQLASLYEDDYSWLWREGHIRHYHLNDYGGAPHDWSSLKPLPIGEGTIDFEQFFTFVRSTGYDACFTLESVAYDADGHIYPERINAQLDRLRELGITNRI